MTTYIGFRIKAALFYMGASTLFSTLFHHLCVNAGLRRDQRVSRLAAVLLGYTIDTRSARHA
jgi:hypothetical protein